MIQSPCLCLWGSNSKEILTKIRQRQSWREGPKKTRVLFPTICSPGHTKKNQIRYMVADWPLAAPFLHNGLVKRELGHQDWQDMEGTQVQDYKTNKFVWFGAERDGHQSVSTSSTISSSYFFILVPVHQINLFSSHFFPHQVYRQKTLMKCKCTISVWLIILLVQQAGKVLIVNLTVRPCLPESAALDLHWLLSQSWWVTQGGTPGSISPKWDVGAVCLLHQSCPPQQHFQLLTVRRLTLCLHIIFLVPPFSAPNQTNLFVL